MATDKGLEDVPEGKNCFPRLSLRLNRPGSWPSSALCDPAPGGGRSVHSLRPQTFLRPRGSLDPGTARTTETGKTMWLTCDDEHRSDRVQL